MADAERAWMLFTDKDVEQDGSLVTLAECLIALYRGKNTFLSSVLRQYGKNAELTPKQARGVLNHFITDPKFAVPLMMYLNAGMESPSNHVLTKTAIIEFALNRVKKKERFVETISLVNPFSHITVEMTESLPEIDDEGRIFPKSWKINLERHRSSTSDAIGNNGRTTRVGSGIHKIHTDSWIKGDVYYLVTECGLYRASVPDPFHMHNFTTDPVSCNKCLTKIGKREDPFG